MINFSTGPSRVHDKLSRYFSDALRLDITGLNHRSTHFKEIVRSIKQTLSEKLGCPPTYTPIFLSSSTEFWYVLSRDYAAFPSYHAYNGAFGERWYQYRHTMCPNDTFKLDFGHSEAPQTPAYLPPEAFLAFVHNETSNGTTLPSGFMEEVRQKYPESIIAVDASSCMGGEKLAWEAADIWFSSVQKCFGLPAGMGIMLVNERSMARLQQMTLPRYHNSLLNLYEMALQDQTTFTPNVLNIYFLMRVLNDSPSIEVLDLQTRQRADRWYQFLEELGLNPLCRTASLRSRTALAIQESPKTIRKIKQTALESGLQLGEGYGVHKTDTFRIANFPAHSEVEIQILKDFLKETRKLLSL